MFLLILQRFYVSRWVGTDLGFEICLHVCFDVSMPIGGLSVWHRLDGLIGKPLQQQASLKIGIGDPEVIQLGEKGLECGWVDLFETEGVDVDVLVGRASSVVVAEEIEECRVHQFTPGNHADVAARRIESF